MGTCILLRKVKVKSLSRVRLFATPWTAASQAPPSMGFSRQEYWSGVPFPSPGDFPDSGIEPGSPAFQVYALTSEPPGKPYYWETQCLLGKHLHPLTFVKGASQVALVVKNPPANAGDLRDGVPSLGREDPLEKKMATHSSILENPMDRGAWWATVYRVVKSQTLLNWLRTNTHKQSVV